MDIQEQVEKAEEKLKDYEKIGASVVSGIAAGFVNPFPFSELVDKSERQHTFIVTTPTNDRITVKAADYLIASGCLIFENDNGDNVFALAAGHWVKVEREA